MPAINYKSLPDYLNKTEPDLLPAVFLIYGEEFLYKEALGILLDALLPGHDKSAQMTGYEAMAGIAANIPEAVERLNTYSLLAGATVVGLTDARIFDSKQDRQRLLNNAKTAFENDDIKKAGRYLASLVDLAGLNPDDLPADDPGRLAAAVGAEVADAHWIGAVFTHLMEKKTAAPKGNADADTLDAAINDGFVKGNRLIITSDLVDKRRRLYKTILEKGLVIDCSVPKGDRRDERMAQQTVMAEQVKAFLKKHGKTISPKAYSAMVELTGFDLRTTIGNLEKLTAYSGDRPTITDSDVSAVLTRTRTDPIYSLTNAVADRNLDRSLSCLQSLLSDNIHPLQVFTAIANQVRKLLLAKSFVKGRDGGAWRKGADYNYFRHNVLPHIIAHDQNLQAFIDQNEAMLSGKKKDGAASPKKSSGKKDAAPKKTDLALAPNPKNAYPIYQLILKSDNFRLEELKKAFAQLNKADLQLKTSSSSPQIVLEKLILNLLERTA